MKIKVDAKAIFPCPLEDSKDIPGKNHNRAVRARRCAASNVHAITYGQQTLSRNGSESHFSIAQNGIGKRIQFSPEPAISAMSSSV